MGRRPHEKGQLLDERHPTTTLGARFSIPHIAAVAAISGGVDLDTLSSNSLVDPEVAELRQRVTIRTYRPRLPPPNDLPARVGFVFSNGMKFEAECLYAQGSPSTPLGLETIRRKVDEICRSVYPRMSKVMDQLVGPDEGTLEPLWENVVSRITGES
ncbi:MAG: hypothetical protein QF652_08005 [Dehalococcoidia bacterium]|jgi:2-methylcitrate dehydratase PrpD|nr:hypothetical protein [Dehalococcoidia bacterium]